MSRKSTWREISLEEARELDLPKNWNVYLRRDRGPAKELTVPERMGHLHEWLVYPATDIFVNNLKRSDPEQQTRWEARHALGYYMAYCVSCGKAREEFADEPKSTLEDDVGIPVSLEERYEHLNSRSESPPGDAEARALKVPWPITEASQREVLETVQSAQQIAEETPPASLVVLLARARRLSAWINRPVATVAENLAAAAMKLSLSRLESPQGRADPSLERLVASYNERVAAFTDMWELVGRQDWLTLRARYGNTRRDVGAGCLHALAGVFLIGHRT